MTWSRRYRVRLYLRTTVWVLPALAILLALALSSVFYRVESALGTPSVMNPDAARTVLITLASAVFTCIVFLFSTLLLALQLASAQLTPRAIAVVFSDPVAKASSALLAFTFTFVISVVVRMDDTVPPLTARIASYLCIASLITFFYLIDHMGKAVRPSLLLRSVGMRGRKIIETVYPCLFDPAQSRDADSERTGIGAPDTVVSADAAGTVLACDVPGLVTLARRADCVFELVPQIGDFIASGQPLFGVFGKSSPSLAQELRQRVAIGPERTMDQDPIFAFRIIVDIASKALSPAINDPTTAVLAVDQVHHLLREVGERRLEDERTADGSGRVRLIFRTPNWGDFVHLAVTEIRQYGRESLQVTRRLNAMLESLIAILPSERASLLRQELTILHRSAVRFFPDPEDLALADMSDPQGVGGRTEEHARPTKLAMR